MRHNQYAKCSSRSLVNSFRPTKYKFSILSENSIFKILISTSLGLFASTLSVSAQPYIPDTQDPWGQIEEELTPETPSSNKSAEELTEDAEHLLNSTNQLLEARTNLLKAINKDPKYYPAYFSLGYYYMAHVSHFRLAMKYIKGGERLFYEQHGPPPYTDRSTEGRHAQLLYLLSQARLNLDDYSGALKVLDQIKDLGYITSSYPGSRAWVLMKLGRLDEAIKEAKLGLVFRAEPARTLNMLGILLSMNGQPEPALQALKEAARIEERLGIDGQPATPTNNMGEVFKEMFQDEKAASSWIRAKSFHDGCEHVLPSLNLALLYIDQLEFSSAKQAIESFRKCVAQYTLKSGEEHRALVHLAQARFNLHAGYPNEALKELDEAYENIQWFGKIGTNQDDLEVGITITKAQAYEALANRASLNLSKSIVESAVQPLEILRARVASWWLFRKSTRLLSERLKNIEDLTIRNTDSLIEYSSLGRVLSAIPSTPLSRRLDKELLTDKREEAKPYYAAYRGESFIKNKTDRQMGIYLLKEALKNIRSPYDHGLRLRILLVLASITDPSSSEYVALAEEIFSLWPPALLSAGLPLPVKLGKIEGGLSKKLAKSGFIPVYELKTPFAIEVISDGTQPPKVALTLSYVKGNDTSQKYSVNVEQSGDRSAADIEAIKQLKRAVFEVKL